MLAAFKVKLYQRYQTGIMFIVYLCDTILLDRQTVFIILSIIYRKNTLCLLELNISLQDFLSGLWFIADVLKDDHVQRVIHPPTSCAYKNTWIHFVIKAHVLLLYDG